MQQQSQGALVSAYEILELPSGLHVQVRPMPGYSSVHAVYGTRFGSIDRTFEVDGKLIQLPAGVAHFLEHKMFESEYGDAFAQYAKTGAQANAFTSFDKTCYIFTATQKVEESLDILLSMVGKPYFTEQTIAKEQGIIGQEIKMYDDSPDWRMMTAMFACLYENHNIKDDIAGSVESIAQITPEMLYDCCKAFYQPENMLLTVAGNVTKEQVLEACERAGLAQPRMRHTVRRIMRPEPQEISRKFCEFSMPIAKPCFAIGYREHPITRGDVKREIICDILTELVCGGMTPLYRRLYDSGMINPEFDGEFLSVEGACCILFTGESDNPAAVEQELKKEIERLRREGVNENTFTLCKNQMYGEMIADLENVEDSASDMSGAWMKGRTLTQEIEALAELTKADVDEALQNMLLDVNSATVLIHPEEGEEE